MLERRIQVMRKTAIILRQLIAKIVSESKTEIKKPYSENIVKVLSQIGVNSSSVDNVTYSDVLLRDDNINHILDLMLADAMIGYGEIADIDSAYREIRTLTERTIVSQISAMRSLSFKLKTLDKIIENSYKYTTVSSSTFSGEAGSSISDGMEINQGSGTARLASDTKEYISSGSSSVSVYPLSGSVDVIYSSDQDTVFSKDQSDPCYLNIVTKSVPTNSELSGRLRTVPGLVVCIEAIFQIPVLVSRIGLVPFGYGKTTLVDVMIASDRDSTIEQGAVSVMDSSVESEYGFEINFEEIQARKVFIVISQSEYRIVSGFEKIYNTAIAEDLDQASIHDIVSPLRNRFSRYSESCFSVMAKSPFMDSIESTKVIENSTHSYVIGFSSLSISHCSYTSYGYIYGKALDANGHITTASIESEGIPVLSYESSGTDYIGACAISSVSIGKMKTFMPLATKSISGVDHLVDGSIAEQNIEVISGVSIASSLYPVTIPCHFLINQSHPIYVMRDGKTFVLSSGNISVIQNGAAYGSVSGYQIVQGKEGYGSRINIGSAAVEATDIVRPGSTVILLYRAAATSLSGTTYVPSVVNIDEWIGRPTMSGSKTVIPGSDYLYTIRPLRYGEAVSYPLEGSTAVRGSIVTDERMNYYRVSVSHPRTSSIKTAVSRGFVIPTTPDVYTPYSITEYSKVKINGTPMVAIGQGKGEETRTNYIVRSGKKYVPLLFPVTSVTSTYLVIESDSIVATGVIVKIISTNGNMRGLNAAMEYTATVTASGSDQRIQLSGNPTITTTSYTSGDLLVEVIGFGVIVGNDGRLFRLFDSSKDMDFLDSGTLGLAVGVRYRRYDATIDPVLSGITDGQTYNGNTYRPWIDAYVSGTASPDTGDYCRGSDILVYDNTVYKRVRPGDKDAREKTVHVINGNTYVEQVFSRHENTLIRDGSRYVLWTERAALNYYADPEFSDTTSVGGRRTRFYRLYSDGIKGYERISGQTYVAESLTRGPFTTKFWYGVFNAPATLCLLQYNTPGSYRTVGSNTVYATPSDYVLGTLVVKTNGTTVSSSDVYEYTESGLMMNEFYIPTSLVGTTITVSYIPLRGDVLTGYEQSAISEPKETMTYSLSGESRINMKVIPYIDRLITTSPDFVMDNGIFILTHSRSVVYEPIRVYVNGIKAVDVTDHRSPSPKVEFPQGLISNGDICFYLYEKSIVFSKDITGIVKIDFYLGAQSLVPGFELYRADDRKTNITPEISSYSVLANVRR